MKNIQRISPKIPDGMVELLKNLAKAILKEQPDDIYVFAAEYFENLVRQRDGGALDKGYGKFRKSDLEITQLDGIDVCPRCHCTLHPVRNELVEPPDNNEPSTSPKNTAAAITAGDGADENEQGMSVNGVAIKAVPRDGKSSSKNQKNRPRLETIRSLSTDSAIDDDAKTPRSTSPKSNEEIALGKQSDPVKPKATITSTSEKTIVKGKGAVAAVGGAAALAVAAAVSNKHHDEHDLEISVPAIKTPPNEMDDIDSSPNETATTTNTSVSEPNTDRTVIEIGAPSDRESSEIITVVTEPSVDEQQTKNATIIHDDMDHLQLHDAKPMDRSRTPESDSGLSEKSFNLAVHEGAETTTNEINSIESEKIITTTTTTTSSTTTVSESTVERVQIKSAHNDFDTHSKDDSGIMTDNKSS